MIPTDLVFTLSATCAPVEEHDRTRWRRWMADRSNVVIMETRGKRWRVVTTFLGMDLGIPAARAFFTTRIIGAQQDNPPGAAYSLSPTWSAAWSAHSHAVELMRHMRMRGHPGLCRSRSGCE